MTELQKAFAGQEFDRRDEEVMSYQGHIKELCHLFNSLQPNSPERKEALSQILNTNTDYIFVETGFECVFGKNIHFKGMAMLNYNCTLLDSNIITIGHCALIGPGCTLVCTNHSLDAEERLSGKFNDKPIIIGDKAWLGANVTVLPGVNIGEGAVIGAGSLVTRDIPAYTLAVGNPCRVVRELKRH